MNDKEFLEMIVKALVEKPEDVVVDRTIDERGVLLTLKVNPAEMGKIIGKQGQTARSLRTLLRIMGNKNNSYVNLKVYEPEKEGRPAPTMSAPMPHVETQHEEVDDLKL
jgi:predicted RNA-binding protein YlqC (UPF0109 family)